MLINKKSIYLGSLLLTTALFFVQCSNNKIGNNESVSEKDLYNIPGAQRKINISPAFEGLDVPYLKYAVDCKQGKKINVEKTGTIIDIPADAFVDAKGNPLSGEVEISFREFHDAADIIASGIPMQNPETGEYMETAGMFEIRGNVGGQEVFIKGGKKIDITLASYNDGNRFDFFKLNGENRWDTEQKKGEPTINILRAEELKKISAKLPNKPVEPVKFGKTTKFVFDMKTDYKKFPELSIFRDVIWQFAGNTTDKDNPENNLEVFNTNWSSIDVVRTADCYKLMLKNKDKSFEMRVQPVLKGKDYEKAMADFQKKMQDFDKVKEAMAQKIEMLENQAELQRSYAVSGFGIYNWDFWKDDSRFELQVEVDFDPEFDYAEKLSSLSFFLVNNNRKAVVKYTLEDLSKRFAYPKGEDNMLVAVLPGNKVACFSKEDFKELNSQRGQKVVFRMKTSSIKINSIDDISKVLAMN